MTEVLDDMSGSDSSAEIVKKIQQFYAINEELYNEIARDDRVPGNKFIPPIDYLSEYISKIVFENEATNFVKNSDERFHRWWPYLGGFFSRICSGCVIRIRN